MSEDSAELAQFRADVAAWLDANCPDEMRDGATDHDSICWGGRHFVFQSDAQRLWLERMAQRGWTAPRWPAEYGGGGLTREEDKVLREEMARIHARVPLFSFGLMMLGPALLAFGREDQKREHLPRIVRGEIRWCQGYSEPGAGSDLASLQTRGVLDGDEWVINGQKIWTSCADQSDMIFCLVRTDREAPKHRGISFLLVDMDQPGIETRPIKLISGRSPFCETFFTDARTHKDNVVGEVNRGWDVAKYLLTHERAGVGGFLQTLAAGRSLAEILNDAGTLDDPVLRAGAMRCEVDSLAFSLTCDRYADQAKAGHGTGDASAMLKYLGTEINKDRLELIMSALGSEATDWEGDEGIAANWLRTKANSIEGGTSEIMLSIISRRILELPQ
ncbi:acyl-CoA dehydrogenase [Acuticoccus sediminis]|uniref:Acyl-CoA dehydrogenase n=1 Tax=Acuticoccus sediminis TaxID=2184697 RepID=A0A8B2NIV1_9HYPH|nr:acyl-CoA dehydrogenase family protein [Acuticoccus sediminis]RAH98216.1 acyl-CoA dehydrogenase [Acuticoccus sediminis]